MSLLSPREVLKQVADALPADCRGSIIIIGSLAAGYQYFQDDPEALVQTKDVDCMLSPHIEVVPAGKIVAQSLFGANWQMRKDENFGEPGTADTPIEELPLVRLHPPGGDDWFIELMMSPPGAAQSATEVRDDPQNPGKQFVRLEIEQGHFGLCSFGYLSLVEEQPIATEFGIAIARPEMMALANLLHHPKIGDGTMSGLIEGRRIKRSNKDLGRVIALAWLANRKEEDAVLAWPEAWAFALQKRFPGEWKALAARAGNGLREMLASLADQEQAAHSCTSGLLARHRLSAEQLAIEGQRLMQDAIEPLESIARK